MGHDFDRDATIATLQRLGLDLRNPGALDPDEHEPVFLLTSEDEDGSAFAPVLTYDAEMVESASAYAEWVLDWVRVTGAEGRVTDVDSTVDFDGGASWLTYTLDGVTRRLEFRQDDDWLVPEVADTITSDLGDVPGRTRLYLDNGQGGTYVRLPPESVEEFRALFPEAEEG